MNKNNGAYALTLICPIKNGKLNQQSFASLTRQTVQDLQENELSPLAKVPNTYLARFYILNDVFYEGSPAKEDHLKSKYLVFSSNFHGDLETYLKGFWAHAESAARNIWQHCVGFEKVQNAEQFVHYIERCQVDTTYFFNGSSGEPLAEQLKALYLRQCFSEFVIEQQGASAEALHKAFKQFVETTQPDNLAAPTWAPGKSTL